MGARDTTFVKFTYRDATNGLYELEWQQTGHPNVDFLRLRTEPKRLLLQPFGGPEAENQKIKIVAVEGVKSWETVVAEPGLTSP